MPITAANMAKNEATITVKWGEDTANVTFYPGKVTEAMIEHIDGPTWGEFNEALIELIKSWDVLDSDGSMFPLDPERLKEIALAFRIDVARGIVRYIRPEFRATQTN